MFFVCMEIEDNGYDDEETYHDPKVLDQKNISLKQVVCRYGTIVSELSDLFGDQTVIRSLR